MLSSMSITCFKGQAKMVRDQNILELELKAVAQILNDAYLASARGGVMLKQVAVKTTWDSLWKRTFLCSCGILTKTCHRDETGFQRIVLINTSIKYFKSCRQPTKLTMSSNARLRLLNITSEPTISVTVEMAMTEQSFYFIISHVKQIICFQCCLVKINIVSSWIMFSMKNILHNRGGAFLNVVNVV